MPLPFRLRLNAGCIAASTLLAFATAGAHAGGLDSWFSDTGARTAAWLAHPQRPLTWGEWQFIQVVPREHVGDDEPNQQPIALGTRGVASLLSKVMVHDDDDSTERLFSQSEINRLSLAVSGALSKASANEDIVFETSGPHASFGPFSKKLTNTGRIFFVHGQLNLIVGLQHLEETGNLRPDSQAGLYTGSRGKISPDVHLAQPDASQGQLKRADWIVLSEAVPTPAIGSASAAQAPARATPTPAPVTAPVSVAVPKLAPAPAGEDAAEAHRMSTLGTRLRLLKRLHEQGLLTDDEYKQKRAEVIKQM